MLIEHLKEAWRRGFRFGVVEGKAQARSQCDVCPARWADGQPALISGVDLMRRPAIEN